MTTTTGEPVRQARRQFHELTVARIDPLCDDAAAVTFDVPGELAGHYRFQPGQSLTLRRITGGRDERRSYSICAPEGHPLRIGVREVPGGAVSGWLIREVSPGDRVEVQPPSGSFTADLNQPARHVLIAAGSGITPVLSVAASALRQPKSEVTLLYGNRRAESVMFADEIADLKDTYPGRLQLVHVLSREPQEVDLFSGRLDAERLRRLLPALGLLAPGLPAPGLPAPGLPARGDVAAVDHWWLCGPYGMVTGAIDVLTEHGVPATRIHRELFYVEDTPPEQEHHEEVPLTGGCELTLTLDGRTTTTTIPAGTPVLDGGQLARPDLPFACKGGVCGTCRARLTGGEVRMRRNYALEPAELDAGYVLTCQSMPVTDQVTVDYDA